MSQNAVDSHNTDRAFEEWVDVPENLTIPHHLIKSLFDTDLHILHQSCVALHTLLDERFPPILPMVEAGLVPRLLEMVDSPSVPIQREVVWILARLASGPPEPVHIMVSRGAVPKLANIMASSSCEEVRDTAAWALGNILGHPSIIHKLPLQGAFGSYQLLRGACTRTFLRSLYWAYDHLKPYMSVQFRMLYPSVEEGVESWTFIESESETHSADVPGPSSSRSSICTYSDQELRKLLNASLTECLATAILHMQDPCKI